MKKLDVQFFKAFVDGTLKTLSVQCSVNAECGKPFIKNTKPQPEFDLAGVISISCEAFNGTITLCFPEKVFLAVMSSMLGEPYTEITADLENGAAEILNIIFGTAKTVLNQQGYLLEKAIPTVIRGINIRTSSLSSKMIMVLPFATASGEFHIEICSETQLS